MWWSGAKGGTIGTRSVSIPRYIIFTYEQRQIVLRTLQANLKHTQAR
jgi:hypothetical protein